MSISEGTIIRMVAGILLPDSVIAQNVFHTVLTTIVGDNDNAQITNDLAYYMEGIIENILGQVDSDAVPTGIECYEYDPIDDDFDLFGVSAYTAVFTGSGDMLPHGVAGVMNFSTTDPDTQGRKYLPGFTEATAVEGKFSAATLVAMLAYGEDVTDLFTAPVSGNEFSGGVWSPTETVFKLYQGAYSANAVPGYQRRRKPGVGI